MSYAKAIRVVDAISTRYADTRIRVALSEVKAVIEALDAVAKMPGGGAVEKIDVILARADPKRLPPVAPTAPSQERTQVRSEAQMRAYIQTWSPEFREEVFDFLGQGHQIRAAQEKFGKTYSDIRKRCLKHHDDARLQHLTAIIKRPVDV